MGFMRGVADSTDWDVSIFVSSTDWKHMDIKVEL